MTKKMQNIWRKEMLALMNEDADWYRNEDTERFKRIQELAKKLTCSRFAPSCPCAFLHPFSIANLAIGKLRMLVKTNKQKDQV